jgi:bifunctional DNA-binding transcriptional regulator/antitoxin component of YhaV-PrlF toxin-antitoxin module
LLSLLQNNVGPTETMALLPGSPAIDAGRNAYATDWDQRDPGYRRIVNGIIDIGAFEVQNDASGPAASLVNQDSPNAWAVPASLLPLGKDQAAVMSSALSPTPARIMYNSSDCWMIELGGARPMRATIDQEGRIPLGRELQGQLGLKPGDEVILENRGAEWVIKAAKAEGGLCREGNVLVHRGVCTEPMEMALANLRDERLQQLSEGLTR